MGASTHITVLIGIDFYLEKPLQSCVQDVNLVQDFLLSLQKTDDLTAPQITRLTASNPRDTDTSCPPEDSLSWPTLQNVTEKLRQIKESAADGDHVYIHYSGHGTVLPGGEFALALLDSINVGRPCYLSGLALSQILNDMVNKGLKVLLVLDCCFSGGVERREKVNNTRFIEYDASCNPGSPHDLVKPISSEQLVGETNLRGVSTRANWLVDPKGYTMLTACGRTEQTRGLKLENGQTYGALSYILVRALRKLKDLKMSNMVIFQFVCAMYRASGALETPQLKGNGDLTFFGHLDGLDDSMFPVFRLSSGELAVQAGEVFNVRENDEFALTSLDGLRNDTRDQTNVTAYARKVGGVESLLELTDASFDLRQIQRGWIARPARPSRAATIMDSSVAVQVRDVPALNDQAQHSDPEAVSVVSPPSRGPVMAHFKAIVNNQDQFEILDLAGRAIKFDGLSLLSPRSRSASRQVSRLLAHLEKFEEVANMIHSDDSLNNSVDIQLRRTSNGSRAEETGGFIEVQAGEVLKLSVKSTEKAYVHIFYLTPTWEIEDLLGDENVPLSEDPVMLDIEMNIPETLALHGYKWCEDIIKIFITTRPAPFGSVAIRLPLLRAGEPAFRDRWLTRSFRIRTFGN